jgi:branched-chain amino acid transport system permease protein
MAAKLFTRIREITLIRSLGLVIIVGAVLMFISGQFGAYNDSQIATGLYFFAALAGLTMLIGLSGQVSLGHGAFLAVGAYTTVLLVSHGWALVPAIVVATAVSVLLGIPVGIAASRLRGPYLAGATLAFAVGLPALADRYPTTFGGENGLTINPPIPPSSLGANFSLERWQLYIAGAGALIVLWVLYNLVHSGASRQLRAVRDDEVAA